MSKYLSFTALAALLLASCYNDKKDQLYPTPSGSACDTANVSYSATIAPIMAQNCALSGCHNAATASDGVMLEDYDGVKNAAYGGRLVGAIEHASGYVAMPQAMPKLDDCTISKIAAWVNAGTPNN